MASTPILPSLSGPAAPDWPDRVREAAAKVHPDYFTDFKPASESEIAKVESQINRTFPQDYKRFLTEFGGWFDAPEDLPGRSAETIFFFTGTAFKGKISDEDHAKLYRSRGSDNANPDILTPDLLMHDTINLLNLLIVGGDGMGCSHAIHYAQKDKPLGYVLMTDSHDFEDPEPNFADGLHRIMQHQYEYLNTDYGEPF